MGIYTKYNSFLFKSNGLLICFFKLIPKTVSNQHLEKPINPRTLAIKKTNRDNTGVISKRPQKI